MDITSIQVPVIHVSLCLQYLYSPDTCIAPIIPVLSWLGVLSVTGDVLWDKAMLTLGFSVCV